MSKKLMNKMSTTEIKKVEKLAAEHIFKGIEERRMHLDRYTASMKFYFNKQLNSREKAILNLKGQEHFIVNMLRPNLKSLQGFLTANKPSWNVLAVGRDDSFARQISNGMLSYIWDISRGYQKVYRVTRNGVVAGIGTFLTTIDYRRNQGVGDIVLKNLPFENFIPDWRVSDPYDPYEARFQAILTTDFISAAIAMRPEKAREIYSRFSTGYVPDFTLIDEDDITVGKVPETGENTALVQYAEYYRIYDQKVYEMIDKYTGEIFHYLNEPEIIYPNYFYTKIHSKPILEKYLMLYNGEECMMLDKEVFPFREPMYLANSFINEDTDNHFGLGEVYFTTDMQRWLNKSYQQTLLHTQISASPVTFVDKHEDLDAIEKKSSIAGSVIGVDMTKGTPVFRQPAPLTTAWFQLTKDFSNLIQNQMGTYAPFTGDPSFAQGNASETLMLQERGADRARAILRNFELALENCGKVTWEMAKLHYDFPMWLRWLDERQRPKQVFVNGVVVKPDGSTESFYLKQIDFDIKLVTSSYQPVNNMAHTRVLQELLQIAPEYARDPLFMKIMQYLQIEQDIIDEIEQNGMMIPKLLEQLQQQAQQIEEMSSMIDTLKNKLITTDQRMVKAQFEADLSGQLSKAKAALDTMIATSKANIKNVTDQYKNKLEKQLIKKEKSNAEKS